MKTKADIRRENVRDIIKHEFDGVVKDFADAVGKTPAQISNITRDKNPSNIGEKVARLIEQQLNKPSGYLDLEKSAKNQERNDKEFSSEQIKFLTELKEVKDQLVHLEILCAESSNLITVDFYSDLRQSLHDISYTHRAMSEIAKRRFYELVTEQFLNWYDLNGTDEIVKVGQSGIDPESRFISRYELVFEVIGNDDLDHFVEVHAYYGSGRKMRVSDYRVYSEMKVSKNPYRLDRAYMIHSESATTFLYIPDGCSINKLVSMFFEREDAIHLARKIQQFEKFNAQDLDKIKSNQKFYDYLLSPFQNTEIFK